jgi:hypothetical protein
VKKKSECDNQNGNLTDKNNVCFELHIAQFCNRDPIAIIFDQHAKNTHTTRSGFMLLTDVYKLDKTQKVFEVFWVY